MAPPFYESDTSRLIEAIRKAPSQRKVQQLIADNAELFSGRFREQAMEFRRKLTPQED